MNKQTFLFQALSTTIWHDVQWIISLLSYTKYDIEPQPQPYSIKYEGDKAYYYDNSGQWLQLAGTYKDLGLFVYNEPIDLPPEILSNAPQGVKGTTVGRVLMNLILLADPFKDKILYINKRFSPGDIESILKKNLHDTPLDPSLKEADKIYIDEYVTYSNNALFLTQLTQVCVPALTEKALLPPKGVEKLREQLLKENEGKLNDPTVGAQIGEKLVEYDLNWMKGDRSLGFLINKNKDFRIVRKKQFLAIGHETNFEGEGHIGFNSKPLCEGMDYTKIDEYVNASRLGSYSRGAETQLGGVAVKELLRVSSNLKVSIEDCGTNLGVITHLTEDLAKDFIGYRYIDEKTEKSILITQDNYTSLIGKDVHMRSPAYCKEKGTGFCSHCAGPRLSLHKTGLSSAVAAMGSIFLYAFMKSMHGKVARTTRLDFDNLIT